MSDISHPQAAAEPDPIVFFDGVCGLCNASVDFLLRHDRRGQLLVSPLQGQTAQRLLPAEDRRDLGSLVLWDGDRTWRRSAAIVRILWRMGGAWSVAGSLLWMVPLPLRDAMYRLVAASRYRLFGKKETCRLPTPEERSRFLD